MAKALNKTQVYTNVVAQVQALLVNTKHTKVFQDSLLNILETNLAPKSGGGSLTNPPKIEDGKIVEAWCRFHERYEVVEDMVMSKDKSKGYCKSSISLWNKTNSQIKSIDAKASDALTKGDFEEAQAFAKEAKELKDTFNLPAFYDYDRDHAAFNA